MAADGSRRPPVLATWAEVDPARYPFDPVEVPAVMRTMVPAPPPRPVWRDGQWVGEPEAYAWIDAVGTALSDRYGPWAYRWYWGGPGEIDRLGWITDRIPTAAEAPAFVTDSLLTWRRWLEGLAERFDRFVPLLDPVHAAGPGDIVTAWETAVTQLVTAVIARVADEGWSGWCRRVLEWLLTAAGVPVGRAQGLVEGAIDQEFDHWMPPTAASIAVIAERLARDVLRSTGRVPTARTDNWPDTWPHGWPSWRATNMGSGLTWRRR